MDITKEINTIQEHISKLMERESSSVRQGDYCSIIEMLDELKPRGFNMDTTSQQLIKQDAEIQRLKEVNGQLVEALKEITKAEGAYSRDQLIHANNVINNMKSIAAQALTTNSPESDIEQARRQVG